MHMHTNIQAHTRMHAHTHARTHARTHTHTHTNTHTHAYAHITYTKLSAGLKRSQLGGGTCPMCPARLPLALDPLVVMAVIRNNEWPFSECINVLMCIGKYFGTLRADRYKQADRLTE